MAAHTDAVAPPTPANGAIFHINVCRSVCFTPVSQGCFENADWNIFRKMHMLRGVHRLCDWMHEEVHWGCGCFVSFTTRTNFSSPSVKQNRMCRIFKIISVIPGTVGTCGRASRPLQTTRPHHRPTTVTLTSLTRLMTSTQVWSSKWQPWKKSAVAQRLPRCSTTSYHDEVLRPPHLTAASFAYSPNRSTDGAISDTLPYPTWTLRALLFECFSLASVQHLTQSTASSTSPPHPTPSPLVCPFSSQHHMLDIYV